MRFLERAWYANAGWLVLLWPLAKLFELFGRLRRRLLLATRNPAPAPVPVIVVGNITVGGTGKTALLVALGHALRKAGLEPGVVSRGYKSRAPHYPYVVDMDSPPEESGDEPLMIRQSLDCPVVIGPDRAAALELLLSRFHCDVVLSDDGLQHYRLPRDVEIAVVDGERLLGNRMCLPAGPLRESAARLQEVDHVIINGPAENLGHEAGLPRAVPMRLVPTFLVNLVSGERKPYKGAPFNIGATVHAVSGIGNPSRFFQALRELPYEVVFHEFPDHHPFTASELHGLGIDEREPIVMTEKDAVKCRAFAQPNYWYLAAKVTLPAEFLDGLLAHVKGLAKQRRRKSARR